MSEDHHSLLISYNAMISEHKEKMEERQKFSLNC
jgi:hypothetical protein